MTGGDPRPPEPAEKNKLTLRAVQSIDQRRRVGQGDPTNRLFLLFTHRVQRETQSESESESESKMHPPTTAPDMIYDDEVQAECE